MPRTFTARTVDDALEVLRAEAHDGDTVRLVWPSAGMYSKAAVESTAMALGLDVVVVVGPPSTNEVTNTRMAGMAGGER